MKVLAVMKLDSSLARKSAAAASRLLAKRGRVPFRLQLTFASAQGAVSTATYGGVLVKRLPRPRGNVAAPARPAIRPGRE